MPINPTTERPCRQCGATEKIGRGGFCNRLCYFAYKRAGDKAILMNDGSARIPLRSRTGTIVGYAIVDASDAAWATQWAWRLDRAGYVFRGLWNEGSPVVLKLHRELLGLAPNKETVVDHIDRNRLNNKRENLRIIPSNGNAQNVPARGGSSQFRGVFFRPEQGTWRAGVRVNRKMQWLGTYATEMEAVAAAKEARARLLPYAVD